MATTICKGVDHYRANYFCTKVVLLADDSVWEREGREGERTKLPMFPLHHLARIHILTVISSPRSSLELKSLGMTDALLDLFRNLKTCSNLRYSFLFNFNKVCRPSRSYECSLNDDLVFVARCYNLKSNAVSLLLGDKNYMNCILQVSFMNE